MIGARWFRLVMSAVLCVLACTFTIVGASASAATRFGETGEFAYEAESTQGPVGVAVDATGNVYVADTLNNRLDKFGGDGSWQWASGVGVIDAAPEMQICTTSCLEGSQTGDAAALELPSGVAVDTDPLSGSYGDVYVVDEGHSRVEKFGPEGEFILMFGGNVNAEASPANPDVCTATEKCNLYAVPGSEDGEFSYMGTYGSNSFIGVGRGGAVYVGDQARVEVFEPTGAWKENISLSGLSTEARPTALALDSSGDVFVKDAGVAGVHELEPPNPPTTIAWSESPVKFDETSGTVTALAVDDAGHLFVGDSSGGFHILEYDMSGKPLESFARKTVEGENGGLVYSSTTGEIYASDSSSSIWAIPLPAAGPAIDSESATPELRGAAILEAQVNPEEAATTVHFEYVDEAHFSESGYASATSTTPVSIGSGIEDQTVSAHPALTPGTVYHFRVVATSSQGTTTGADQVFQEIPPAQITGPWASDVAGTSVTLNAEVDPLGASTAYRIEYGTSVSYGQTVSGSVGEGMSDVPISHHFQGLEPVTEYHYRVVTSSEVGTWQSPDRTFTTQGAAGELTLPDGRVWELVSPANKHGALIETESVSEVIVQAAADGSGIAYPVTAPVSEAPMGNHLDGDQALATRGPDGWRTQEVEAAQRLSGKEGEEHEPFAFGTHVRLFSSDLSSVLIEPDREDVEPLATNATERTLYVRDDVSGAYLPLVTPANVPTGTKFGGEAGGYKGSEGEMKFLYATPDLTHIVFQSPFRLTPEAVEGPGICGLSESPGECPMNLYEWSDGRLSLVDVLPDGKPLLGEERDGAYLGRADYDVVGAVSNDGRWIAWSHGEAGAVLTYPLYIRDMVEEKTWQIGGSKPRYEMMSGNGEWVFYWEGQDLYAYSTSTHTSTDITADHGPDEHRAGVKDGLDMGISEDGTYIYYAATGVLAPGAVSGEDNLYVSHYDGTSWQPPKLIATLSKADEADGLASYQRVDWYRNYSRVSANGRYLTFLSSRSLTGYDNTDISEQETEDQVGELGDVAKTRVHQDEEAYLYDAVTGRLACVSCSPTGERPSGVPVISLNGLKVEEALQAGQTLVASWRGRWLAATFPSWNEPVDTFGGDGVAMPTQRRYLSNSGQVFFNASSALVPQDTDGTMDVYEYEPAGVGSCTHASAKFSERSGGCVGLLSSGTSGEGSAFLDTSENGEDVFFKTSSKLVGEDYDTDYDVYDAHVCSASVPCRVAPVAPPECTSGDSCKPAPAPQPEIFGATPSATFSGVGNFSETSKPVVKSRSLTRAQRLRRALGACRKEKSKHSRRTACERQARKRFGAQRPGKAGSTKRGK